MSAYIMNDEEINTIISYFVPTGAAEDGAWLRLGESEWNYLNRDNAAKVASILMAENVRSVNAKYGENEGRPYVFAYLSRAHDLPVGNIIGALDCYEYQACEAEDWDKSNALEIAEEEGTYTWGIK